MLLHFPGPMAWSASAGNLGTPESETTGFLHRVKISGVCKNILHRTVHSFQWQIISTRWLFVLG